MKQKAETDEKLLTEEILTALLALAGRDLDTDLRFVGHDYLLQGIFHDLAEEHPVLNDYFVFSQSGFVPYSPLLNEAMAGLQLGGIIGRENPEYEIVFVKPSANTFFNSVVEDRVRAAGILEELKAAASGLVALLKEDKLLRTAA